MFQTITKTKSTSGKLLGVKLTQTLADINDAWVDFNESNIEMLEKIDTLDRMANDVVILENLTKQVKKTKLQPSMCTYLGAMEGVSQLAGVDFKKVNETNRDKMTKIAVESLGDTARNFWAKIKEWFVKILTAVKNFFVRMFSLTARQTNAIKKLQDGILKEKSKIDVNAFASVTMKCWSKTDFKKINDALLSITSNSGLEMVKKSLSSDKVVIDGSVKLGVLGYKFENDKITTDGKKLEKTKKTMKEHGWTVEDIIKEGGEVKLLLTEVMGLKKDVAAIEAANKTAQKQCDTMATLEGKSDAEKEKTKTGITNTRKNLVLYTKLVSIFSTNAHALIGQWISMVSKMKTKK